MRAQQRTGCWTATRWGARDEGAITALHMDAIARGGPDSYARAASAAASA
jgi:hypothetical protein